MERGNRGKNQITEIPKPQGIPGLLRHFCLMRKNRRLKRKREGKRKRRMSMKERKKNSSTISWL